MGLFTCFTAILTHTLRYLQYQPSLKHKEKCSGPCKEDNRNVADFYYFAILPRSDFWFCFISIFSAFVPSIIYIEHHYS